MRGATCAEVFEALILIAALGSDEVSPEPSASREAPSGPVMWMQTPDEEQRLAEDAASEVIASSDDTGLRVAGAALALWGGASKASFDVDLGLALSVRWKTEQLQPFVLLGVYGGGERFGVPGTGAGTRLDRLAAHAVACPLRFPRDSAAGLRPCVDLDAGVLSGSGVSVNGARGHTAPWVSTGLQLRAEWWLWDAVELGAMLGGVVALSRPRFYFLPDTTAFQAEAAGVRAGASASVAF